MALRTNESKWTAFYLQCSQCIKVHVTTIIKSQQHLLTYGAEPFLRSCKLCSHSRTSQDFMQPEGSLPC
jgi:hypothetical protein